MDVLGIFQQKFLKISEMGFLTPDELLTPKKAVGKID